MKDLKKELNGLKVGINLNEIDKFKINSIVEDDQTTIKYCFARGLLKNGI